MSATALVIGQGSIGQRHARLLAERGRSVKLVSARAPGAYRSVGEALAADLFESAIVANVTARHAEAVLALAEADFTGTVLVEKPLCNVFARCADIATAARGFSDVRVGYNLRFHPVIVALRDALAGETLFEARLAVGQYLPDWRPGTDFRAGSSSRREDGGGVLRDLSHEIDLALHLFGPCAELVASGGNLGRLSIETDEAATILMRMASGALVTLHLNYFDRPARRSITVTTGSGTFDADLIAGTLSREDRIERFTIERDATYRALHEALATAPEPACSLSEAIAVMAVIEAVERSQHERLWVTPTKAMA